MDTNTTAREVRAWVEGTERRCKTCEEWKPLTEQHYFRLLTDRQGFQRQCKTCRKATRADRQGDKLKRDSQADPMAPRYTTLDDATPIASKEMQEDLAEMLGYPSYANKSQPPAIVDTGVMTEEEADKLQSEILSLVRMTKTKLLAKLVDANRGKIWIPLGFGSFKAWIEDLKEKNEDLEISWQQAYKAVAAGELKERIGSFAIANDRPELASAVKHWPTSAVVQLAEIPEDKIIATVEKIAVTARDTEYFGKARHLTGRVTAALTERVLSEMETTNVQKVGAPLEGPRTFVDATPPRIETPRNIPTNGNNHAPPKATRQPRAEALFGDEEAGTRENPYRTKVSSCEYDPVGEELLVLALFRGELILVQVPEYMLPADKER